MKTTARILLVDDEPLLLELLDEILTPEGHTLLKASTGTEALRIAREERPELVLLDIGLPDMSGIEVCRKIKSDTNLTDVFVMLFSGQVTSGADQVRGAEAGADDYIIKPVGPEEIVARIRMMVRLRETTVALRASEQYYRSLIEILPDAVGLIDPEGHITGANQQAATMLGYSRSTELLGKNVEELVHAERSPQINLDLASATKKGVVRNAKFTLRKRSGLRFPVEVSVAALKNVNGARSNLVIVARDISERERAEEVLRASEERFRQLAEHIREVFWLTDREKRKMIYISPAYLHVWGRTCESLYAAPGSWVDAIHPEDRDRVVSAAAKKQVSGQYDEIYRIIRPDGSIRWIKDRAFPVLGESGRVYRIAGIAEDITESKAAQASLATLGHAVESTSEFICITDLEDKITFANQAFLRAYKYTQEEIAGKPAEILLSPHNPPGLRGEMLLRTRLGGWRGEVSMRRKDGSEFLAYLSTSQIKDGSNHVLGSMDVAQDITGRKRAEQQIQLLADAVHSAQELISVTDTNNRFIFVNQAFIAAYGYSEYEILGRTPDLLFSSKNPPDLCRLIFQDTLADSWKGELISVKKSGREFPIALTTSQIKSFDGKLFGLLAVARDISDRNRTERQRKAFASLGFQLNAVLTAEQAANIVLEVASDLFGWDAGYLHLYEPEGDRIKPVVTIDTVGGKRTSVSPSSFSLEPSPLMREIMSSTGRLINRPDPDPEIENLERFGDCSRPSASMMYVPIHAAGFTTGILSVQSYTPNCYSPEDLRLLQALADYCGNALQRINVSEALREVDANYRRIFENATEGIFQSTPSGRYRSANPALARLLGYDSPEELIASVNDIELQTYVLPSKRKELRQALETKGFVEGFEAERYRRDGTRIWLRVNAHVVRNPQGEILYYEGTSEDITDRKHIEEALEKSRFLQKALLDNISDPAWLKDASGCYLACNDALSKFYGLTPDQIVGRLSSDFAPLEAAVIAQEDQQVIAARNTMVFETSRTNLKGEVRWFEASKSPIFNERREVTGTVGVAHDITDRKRIEQELRMLPRRIIEAQEAERQRVARELHDSVNQLIASARMRLRKVEESSAEFRPSTREILARCHDLMVQALEENRRIAQDLRPSDLDELGFTIACRNFCKQFKARTNIAVRCNITHFGRRLAPAVELNLFRIVQETFNNVEKHAGATRVQLSITLRDDWIRLKIQDNGQGFSVKSVNQGKRKWRGIGLTNIAERAAAVGGTSEIVSQPGHGTTVSVEVPCN